MGKIEGGWKTEGEKGSRRERDKERERESMSGKESEWKRERERVRGIRYTAVVLR